MSTTGLVTDGQIPSLAALLICDKVIEEAGTAKKSLIGIFGKLYAYAVPVGASFAVYCRLVDAEGRYQLRVRVSKTDDNANERLVVEVPAEVSMANILDAFEFGINFVNIPFNEFGRYDVHVHAGDVFLGHTSMDLIRLDPAAGG